MAAPSPRPSPLRGWIAMLAVAALAFALTPAVAAADDHDGSVGSGLVISQVYGGGGNSGALYRTSFVELFNRTSEPISLEGLSFQRGSATGNLGFSAAARIELSGEVAPHGYFLVTLGDGANDDALDLPVDPDLEGESNPAAGAAKVAIVDGMELLGCGATATPCDDQALQRIVDLVGYGTTTTFYEGSGPAPQLGNNIAALRADDGCQDTDDNATDFSTVSPPEPRNSGSDANVCDEGPGGPGGADVVISQVYGGGGNVGSLYTHDFVELFNRGDESQDLTGWSVQYTSANGTSWGNQLTEVAGALAPGQRYLVQLASGGGGQQPLPEPDAVGTTNMAAVNGKVALVASTDGLPAEACPVGETVVDAVGFGTQNCAQIGVIGPLNNTTAALRDAGRCADTFSTVSPPVPENTSADPAPCDAEPPPPALQLSCQAPFTVTEGYAEADGEFVAGKAITATATNAAGDVDFEVVAVDPEPAAGGLLVTADGASAEVRFSDEVPGLDPTETDGHYTVTIEASDGADSADCTVDVRVVPVLDIGAIRGVVDDDANGRTHTSDYALGTRIFDPHPNHVATIGVVTQRLLEENADGFDFEGFFVQRLASDVDLDTLDLDDLAFVDELVADGDERTSDGLWVSTGTFPTVRPDFPSTPTIPEQYRAEPGDIVVLRGPIIEDFQQTTLANPFVVDVLRANDTGVDLATDVEVVEANPPDDVQEASVYWERLAGMQVEVPADAVVISGNDHFAPSTSEFWVIRGDHPVAQREDPAARRVFRDYHPLSNSPTDLSEGPGDQNAFRILLGSFGIKAAQDDATATITPVRSGDTLDGAVQGGLYFSFEKYAVMPDEAPSVTRGPDPAAGSLEVIDGFDPTSEYSVMVYNVENLYDFRSDPFSGCDLDLDVVPDGQMETSTCTAEESGGSTVRPPFTYAPRSQEAYDAHRIAIAEQILVALDAPDIITIQEAEKQDVCEPVFDVDAPADSFMDCDLSAPADGETMANTDRGSGAPDTIEELAIEIFRLSDGAIRYEASGDAVNGRDVRGITQGFLHRADRVELVPVDELTDDPVLGAGDAVDLPYPSQDERTELAPWVLEAANPKSVNAQLPQSALDAAAALGESIDGGRFPQTRYVFTRGVQVGLFRIYPDGVDSGGPYVERYLTSNHMSAGPDGRTAQRTEQARLNAAVAEAARDHGGQVLATGDFNVFPRPDDPFPAFKTDPDRPPSDQLAPLYERGFANLHDVIIEEVPANTYSFIFRGISQILDHIFVDDATLDELVAARYIHVNVDFPANTPGFEPGRGASDHDPLYARFLFEQPQPVEVCVTFDRDDLGWDWNRPATVTKSGITVTNPPGTHDGWIWDFADEPLNMTSVTVFSNGNEQAADTQPGVLSGQHGSNIQWAEFCFLVPAGEEPPATPVPSGPGAPFTPPGPPPWAGR